RATARLPAASGMLAPWQCSNGRQSGRARGRMSLLPRTLLDASSRLLEEHACVPSSSGASFFRLSAPDGLRFRETGFSSPETQPPKPPLSDRPATPPLAGLSNAFRKSPQLQDC